MADLVSRRCRVTVDALQVEGLTASFKATKTNTKNPNTLELVLTNLSKNSRSQMSKKGARILLEAGYVDTMSLIFVGDARSIEHKTEGANVLTKIESGDGEAAYQHKRFTDSFGPGTKVVDVVKKAVAAMGVNPGNALAKVGEHKGPLSEFAQGFSAHGSASRQLDKLFTAMQLTWSIQDGALQVLSPDEAAPGQAVLLTPDSGLIGSPEVLTPKDKDKPAYTKIKSLLQPRIRPGARLQVESRHLNGLFRCVTVVHTGDTAGGDWYSEAECVPTSG